MPPKRTKGKASKSGPKKEKEEKEDVDEDPALLAREKELREMNFALKKQILELENGTTELALERDSYLFRINELNQQHKTEKDSLRDQIDSMTQKRQQVQERVDRVEKIENAIINLYLEMKDRSMEGDEPRDPAHERDQLKKYNPLVVIDNLRASLRTLLAFKEDYENELKGQLNRKRSEHEKIIDGLNAKMLKMQESERMNQTAADAALKQAEEAELSKELVVKESKDLLDSIKSDNQKLISLLRHKEKELAKLYEALERNEQIIKHQDIKLLRIAQLEHQIQNNKQKHQQDLQKLQAQHAKTLKDIQKELEKYTKTEVENRNLSGRLKVANQQLQAYKNDINRARYSEADKKVERLERIVQEKNEKITNLTEQCRHERFEAEKAKKKSESLKQDYDRIFTALNKQNLAKKRQEERSRKEIDPHKAAEENPYYLDRYKNLLKEKEREVEELTNKVRRLLATEHKNMLASKSFEQERSRFESEIASLRIQASKGSNKRPWSAKVSSSDGKEGRGGDPMDIEALRSRNTQLESQLKDFENLKSISMHTKAAYERLLKSTEDNKEKAVTSVLATPTQNQDPGKLRASRPLSAQGRRLSGIGSNKSTLEPGVLLQPLSPS